MIPQGECNGFFNVPIDWFTVGLLVNALVVLALSVVRYWIAHYKRKEKEEEHGTENRED